MWPYNDQARENIDDILKDIGSYKYLAEIIKEYENKLLPENVDYDQVPNLSLEEKEKLKRIKPTTLAQAGRISGINPTGLQILLSQVLNTDKKLN